MRIICLEGPHGCGKTAVLNELAKKGYNVLDENFIEMPNHGLTPQCLVMESIWVSQWISRILELASKEENRDKTFVADRSPYSAVLYSRRGGHLLEPLIERQLQDLSNIGIEIRTLYIKLSFNTLYDRVIARLKKEPVRKKFGEESVEWLDRAYHFYESRHQDWGFCIDFSSSDFTPEFMAQTMHQLFESGACITDKLIVKPAM